MTPVVGSDVERRALLLAPTGRDAVMTRDILANADILATICADGRELGREVADGCAVILITEEALSATTFRTLVEILTIQPSWSDLPILVLTRSGADSATVTAAMSDLGNVTLLERPVRMGSLLSSVHAAVRARERQYELRERFAAQSLLAAIIQSSDDAIISKTLNGTVQSWNAGAERIFGYTEAEVVGRSGTLIIPADRLNEEQMLLARMVRGERMEHFETVRMAKDGRLIQISLTLSPIHDAAGRIVGISKVARDITLQKRAEQALRDADRKKDEFLATLAHELRNPLAPIRNSLQILKLTPDLPQDVEHLRSMMERQVNHMVRLVDDLMEVSRITRGKIELRREPVDVTAVLRSAIETSQPLIDAAGHTLTTTFHPTPLIVDGDAVRLAQIFANLLNNAAKYTRPGGQIWLTVRVEGTMATVSVRDTGVGISPDMVSRIFDLFAQDRMAREMSQGGLGIGLTLVESLIRMHGGTIAVHSAGAGHGSEFIVRLPLVVDPVRITRAAPERAPRLAPLRVMVVDDNQDSAESLGTLLAHLGARVHIVNSGRGALEALETFRPSIVLLDIGMPEMDGYEVARRMRELDPGHDLMLIALTGWGQDEDRRRSLSAGFDHHLVKPTDVNALQALIASATQRGVG